MDQAQHPENLTRDKILTAITEELIRLGHKRYSKRVVAIDFGDGFFSWLGVPLSRINQTSFEVYVNVGIHAENLNRMFVSLRSDKNINYSRSVTTYAIPIEMLDGVGKLDHIIRLDNYLDKSKEFAVMIAENGIKFSRSIANYETLLPLLKGRLNMHGGYPEFFACCLFFLNRLDEAKQFVEDFNRRSPGYFGAFFANFMKL